MKNLICASLLLISMADSKDITIFAHGIIDDASQSQRFQEAMSTPCFISPSFADSMIPSGFNFNAALFNICSYFGKKVNRDAMFMGQKDDITILKQEISSLDNPDKTILFGCSRGAATILSCLGEYNPENIAAIVLDSCPADMPKSLQLLLAKFGIDPSYCDTAFSYVFPQYNPQTALTPLEAISKIQNKRLPILLIHSRKDLRVHYINSLKLYKRFLEHGFTNVHLFLLPEGKHSFLLQQESVKMSYLNAVHTFYKKYGLPYNAEFAQSDLPSDTLTLNEINSDIKNYENQLIETYNSGHQRNIYGCSTALIAMLMYIYFKKKL